MKPVRVKDVMTREVVVARPDTLFKELVRLMMQHRVSGVPVVDERGRLAGIVTEADLLRAGEEHPEAKKRSFVEWFIHPGRLAEIEARSDDVRAADLMTREVVTVTPDLPVSEAIKALLDARVKRLPVVDEDRRVVGIVSRADLLVPFLRPDEDIAREIREDVIVGVMWIDPTTLEVAVEEGVVTLRGEVDRRSVKEIITELIHRVSGVVGVRDEGVTYRMDDRKLRTGAPYGQPPWSENWVPRRR